MIYFIKEEKSMFNSTEIFEEYKKSEKKSIQILAWFALGKDYEFENKEQVNFFIKRNIRSAKRLECFDLERIIKVMRYLKESADYKWGLETIEKFILEDLNTLKGEKPIIILKNGEKIYDTKKIIELEKEGKVEYKDKKWIEI